MYILDCTPLDGAIQQVYFCEILDKVCEIRIGLVFFQINWTLYIKDTFLRLSFTKMSFILTPD